MWPIVGGLRCSWLRLHELLSSRNATVIEHRSNVIDPCCRRRVSSGGNPLSPSPPVVPQLVVPAIKKVFCRYGSAPLIAFLIGIVPGLGFFDRRSSSSKQLTEQDFRCVRILLVTVSRTAREVA